MTHTITKQALSHFTGSETLYRHPLFRQYCYTEGVQYLGANGASWLVTDIFGFQNQPQIRAYAQEESFQLWTLNVNADQTATLVCEDGNKRVLFVHDYRYTDFPLPELKLYLCDNILLLPSEY
jgi:hypothetical protein